jgi:hypothetical protein
MMTLAVIQTSPDPEQVATRARRRTPIAERIGRAHRVSWARSASLRTRSAFGRLIRPASSSPASRFAPCRTPRLADATCSCGR